MSYDSGSRGGSGSTSGGAGGGVAPGKRSRTQGLVQRKIKASSTGDTVGGTNHIIAAEGVSVAGDGTVTVVDPHDGPGEGEIEAPPELENVASVSVRSVQSGRDTRVIAAGPAATRVFVGAARVGGDMTMHALGKNNVITTPNSQVNGNKISVAAGPGMEGVSSKAVASGGTIGGNQITIAAGDVSAEAVSSNNRVTGNNVTVAAKKYIVPE